MKLKELIEKYEAAECVVDFVSGKTLLKNIRRDLEQLDEPETGHADEAPRYLKNILARLRELPLHNREVWLKVIMSEFKQDFSHAKWREGYEQGKLEGMVEREKVKVPQFVADWIEEGKKHCKNVSDLFDTNKEVGKWFLQEKPFDLVARAWLDGYEIAKEKKYSVRIKNIQSGTSFLKYDLNINKFYFGIYQDSDVIRLYYTREELEKAGFSWVFSCEGVEIEEVE